MARRHGFTLLELVAGITVSLLVTSAVLEVLVLIKNQALKTRVSSELQRNGRNLMSVAGRAIKMAGSGMPPPTSTSPDPNGFPNGGGVPFGNTPIGGGLIVGNTTAFGLVGDYPKPDSNLNGLSFLAQAEGNQRFSAGGVTFAGSNCPRARRNEVNSSPGEDGVATPDATNHTTLMNELTGGCLVGSGCDSSLTSILLPGAGTECGAGTVPSLAMDQPTCPWALKKYTRGEYFLTVFPNQQYLIRRINADNALQSCCAGNTNTIHTHCDAGAGTNAQFRGLSIFYENWGGNGATAGGRNNPAVDMGWYTEGDSEPSLVLPINRGWVSTLERVFIRYNAALQAVEYSMCWGPFASLDAANWRNVSAASPPCNTIADAGATWGKGGTTWVSIAENVSSFAVTYYDLGGNLVAAPGATPASLDAIGAVGIAAVLRRESPVGSGRFVTVRQQSVYQMRARRFR